MDKVEEVKVLSFDSWGVFDSWIKKGFEQATNEEPAGFIVKGGQ